MKGRRPGKPGGKPKKKPKASGAGKRAKPRVPARKQPSKKPAPFPLKKGQGVTILSPRGKKIKVTVVRPAKNPGFVVVKLKETHPRKVGKAEAEEIQKRSRRMRALASRLSELSPAEWDEYWELHAGVTPVGQVTMRNIFTVPAESIIVKEKKEPERQHIPQTQRAKTQKRSVLQRAQSEISTGYSKGASPKRIQRTLASKGYGSVPPRQLGKKVAKITKELKPPKKKK